MNKGLITKGQKEFLGKVINVIEGGFGDNKRILFDVQIAEIHDMRNGHVRDSINRLITRGRMVEGVDFIDLKQRSEQFDTFDLNTLYAKQAITQAKNIFILSERGYTKLIKSMDDDRSWDIMEEIVDNYFTMREIVNSREQLKAQLTLSIYNGGQEGLMASKKLTEMEVEDAVKPLNNKIEEMTPAIEVLGTFIDKDGTWNIEQFAKVLGIEGMGRNNMFKWLRQQKILQGNNTPYQSYMKYFKVISTVKNGYNCIITRINYNGVIYLYRRLRDCGLISPKTVDDILQELNGNNLDIHN